MQKNQQSKRRLNGVYLGILGITFMILGLMTFPSFAHRGDSNNSNATIYQHTHVPIETIQLAESLKKGGYTIFFRHERTQMTEVLRDRLPYDFATCEGQRMLSPAGIASSQEIGQAFRILTIPIEAVFTSPLCRTRDTAQFAFKKSIVTNQLMAQNVTMKRTKADVEQDLKLLVNQARNDRKNIVLVGHLGSALSIKELPSEGEALVLKPDGNSGVTVVGRITSAQWGDIVRDIDRAQAKS